MSVIQNVTLAFPCSEKLETPAEGGFYCATCAHTIIDFRCQSAEALQAALRQAAGKRVCGIFNRDQLSARFLRRVAAASVATTLAATACTPRQDVQHEVTGEIAMPPALTAVEQPTVTPASPLIHEPTVAVESMTIVEATTGMPVMEETPELTICELNSTRFQEILAQEVNQHPEQEDVEGVVRVSVTIDAEGALGNMEVVQGLTAAADREALRALTAVANDLYFEQPRGEDGVAREHKTVVTVIFGGEKGAL